MTLLIFLFGHGDIDVADETVPVTDPTVTPVVDPNALGSSNGPADPNATPGTDPAPEELSNGVLVSLEDAAKARLASALDAAMKAGSEVTAATTAESAAKSALGERVNREGGLVIVLGDTARVLLPDGNGSYHPITVKVVVPAPAPQ